MDSQIRQATYIWGRLPLDNILKAQGKFYAYQAAAYADVLHGYKRPAIELEQSEDEGGSADCSMNRIKLEQNRLADVGVGWDWHEGFHVIQCSMRSMLKTKSGQDYLQKYNLRTDVEIEQAGNDHAYSDIPRGELQEGPTFDAYTQQATESGVRLDEAMALSLMLAIKSKPIDHIWTLTEAQEEFREILPYSILQYTEGPYANVGALADKLRYEEAMHDAFYRTYLNGGEVCIPANDLLPRYFPAFFKQRIDCVNLVLH